MSVSTITTNQTAAGSNSGSPQTVFTIPTVSWAASDYLFAFTYNTLGVTVASVSFGAISATKITSGSNGSAIEEELWAAFAPTALTGQTVTITTNTAIQYFGNLYFSLSGCGGILNTANNTFTGTGAFPSHSFTSPPVGNTQILSLVSVASYPAIAPANGDYEIVIGIGDPTLNCTGEAFLQVVPGGGTQTVDILWTSGAGTYSWVQVNVALLDLGQAYVNNFSISDSGGNLTCTNMASGTELIWTSTGATSVTIEPSIGPVALSGSLVIYPTVTTTYTLTAYASGANDSVQVTVTVDTTQLLIPTLDGVVTWLNSGGSENAGVYAITYLGGGYQNGSLGWTVDGSDFKSNLLNAFKSNAFKVIDQYNAAIMDAPGHYVNFASLAATETANANLVQYFTHGGGPIGIYLKLSSYAGVQSVPITALSPCFCITGPGPSVNLSAAPSVIQAGSSSTLSWSATGATSVVLDNGIGTEATPGTHNFAPTTAGVYVVTLTATYNNVAVSTYCLVTVGQPTVPSNFNAVGEINGNVLISWSATEFSSDVVVQRASTLGGSYSTVGTASGTTYTDTPPDPGVTYFYKAYSTDSYNESGYTPIVAAASIVVPDAPTLAAMNNIVSNGANPYWATVGGTQLYFNTVSGATSYQIFSGLAPGAESDTPLVTLADPGYPTTLSYVDGSAQAGIKTYYVVQAVNAAGNSASSNEAVGQFQWNNGGITAGLL